MKPFLPYSLLAAAAFCGAALGQTATTTPVGYTTQNLVANQFNLVGLNLHNSQLASGTISAVGASSVTVEGVDFDSLLTDGRTYVLEIHEGPQAGTVHEILTWNGDQLDTQEDLGTAGVEAGQSYSLRLAPTLEEIFGTGSDSVLTRALNANTADIVWLPDGTGGYDRYFIHSTGQVRIAGTTTPAPDVPVIYADGLIVQKRNAAAELVVSGEVKTSGTTNLAVPGFNILSTVAPVGLTLFTSGIAGDIAQALNPNTADIVWVQQPDATYKKYFRHSSGSWRDVDAPTVALAEDVPLPSAVIIQRKGASPTAVSLDVPESYANL